MPATLFDKVWSSHVVAELSGGVSLLAIDRHLLHDLEAGPGFTRLADKGYSIRNPELTFATPDHSIATDPQRHTDSNKNGGRLLREMRRGAFAAGVKLFDLGTEDQGILHVIGPELGLTLPGMTIVCPDSHTCTHGGLGALAFGIGSTEVGHVLATQTLRQVKPKTMRIVYEGARASGVTAKDIILATIGQIGTAAGRGHAVEYAGSAIRALTIDERLTICNLSIELGSKIGMIASDETTYQYVRGRRYAPEGALFERAFRYWDTLKTDPDATFDIEHHVDVAAVAPPDHMGDQPTGCDSRDGADSRPGPGTQPATAPEHGSSARLYGADPGKPH